MYFILDKIAKWTQSLADLEIFKSARFSSNCTTAISQQTTILKTKMNKKTGDNRLRLTQVLNIAISDWVTVVLQDKNSEIIKKSR